MTPKVALTIAGSDSGGGAGIQADLKTFAAHGLHGSCAVTALTAQHTAAVLRVMPFDPDSVLAQIHAVLADLRPAAVKTGMLATPEIVKAVADLASRGLLPNLVVDPVFVSASGHSLMEDGGVDAYRTLLLPHAAVVTPNVSEAALLADADPDALTSVDAVASIAEQIRALGPGSVVVTGGNGEFAQVAADVVVGAGGVAVLDSARVETRNDHGAGCSLSAAVASNLALGASSHEAIERASERAKSYVHRALSGAARWQLGTGHGPIDHFGWTAPPLD